MGYITFLHYRVILIAIDPGGSATLAVEILKAKGVPEDRILFLNLIASPSGVADFAERFPKLRVVTAFIDQGLDEKKLIYFYFSLFLISPLTGCYHTGTLSLGLVILVIDTIRCDTQSPK